MKKILLILAVALVFVSCDDVPDIPDDSGTTEEKNAYSATRAWFNSFINATSLQKDSMLSDVSSNPRNWCGKVYDVKQNSSSEYEITLDFGSYDFDAPMLRITTHNYNTASSASSKKGGYFIAKNKGVVTYYHYIYHSISFETD